MSDGNLVPGSLTEFVCSACSLSKWNVESNTLLNTQTVASAVVISVHGSLTRTTSLYGKPCCKGLQCEGFRHSRPCNSSCPSGLRPWVTLAIDSLTWLRRASSFQTFIAERPFNPRKQRFRGMNPKLIHEHAVGNITLNLAASVPRSLELKASGSRQKLSVTLWSRVQKNAQESIYLHENPDAMFP